MKAEIRSVEFAPGKTLSVELGRLAKQSHGAAVVRMGDTMVLSTVVSNYEAKEGQDFFPLTVEFREAFAAGGKFPGGFIKREGRPSEKEILSCRLIDRTIRPLFPEGYYNETQVICQVISSDAENDADVLAGVATSISIMVSDIPFESPSAMVRVGRINGEYIVNPTVQETRTSDFDLIVGGTMDSIAMVEGEFQESSEKEMLDAIAIGHEAIRKLCKFQLELQKEFGKEKREFTTPQPDAALVADVTAIVGNRYEEVSLAKLAKKEYSEATSAIKSEVKEALAEKYPDQEKAISEICHTLQEQALRKMILDHKQRLDGRKPDEIRAIWTEVGY